MMFARHVKDADKPIRSWQLVAMALAMLVSILAGVGAYCFIDAAHHIENRVAWSLQPPKSLKTAARATAPSNLQAAGVSQRSTGEM